jgi:hypothetical protein
MMISVGALCLEVTRCSLWVRIGGRELFVHGAPQMRLRDFAWDRSREGAEVWFLGIHCVTSRTR